MATSTSSNSCTNTIALSKPSTAPGGLLPTLIPTTNQFHRPVLNTCHPSELADRLSLNIAAAAAAAAAASAAVTNSPGPSQITFPEHKLASANELLSQACLLPKLELDPTGVRPISLASLQPATLLHSVAGLPVLNTGTNPSLGALLTSLASTFSQRDNTIVDCTSSTTNANCATVVPVGKTSNAQLLQLLRSVGTLPTSSPSASSAPPSSSVVPSSVTTFAAPIPTDNAQTSISLPTNNNSTITNKTSININNIIPSLTSSGTESTNDNHMTVISTLTETLQRPSSSGLRIPTQSQFTRVQAHHA
ncbi:hypothetical protein FGIG_11310 [Fasciola gigantica]|uniref:Uncharacterized protein n=1 Tax=Fasciola gigantica TaxID=46835 RepID=A0A504Y971_FASGI|nr:hypothetical protein FGIG_11310 [Fasciola gigantica]